MAVSTTNAVSGPYNANGATVTFPFSFTAPSTSEVAVITRDADGFDSTVNPSLYAVSLTSGGGGSVTFDTAPASGLKVLIYLDPNFTQEIEFENGSAWLAEPVNEGYDRSALRDQALKRDIDRAIQVPIGEASGSLLPTAEERAGQFLAFDAEGRPVPASGTGADSALRTDVAASGGAALVGFLQAGTGAVARSLQSKARELGISVKDFGAIGTIVSNDTAAIELADTVAASLGKSLFFPSGTYMTDPTTATTSWFGEIGTVIKNRVGDQSTMVNLVTADGVDDIVFDTLTFDGNVSADPVSWTSGNYDSFTGSAGLSVENCDRAIVRNCRAQNTRQHGFRFKACLGAAWQGCTSYRSRGNFGDGFIALSSIGTSVSDCFADDYTRIGFVFDTDGANLTSYKISVRGCLARNGHDASALYGGGEFNAGIWAENVGDIALDSCFAWDNTHRGINVCTGVKNNGFPGSHAVVLINNCHVVDSDWGIQTYSLDTFPIISKVTNSSAKLCTKAFEGDARLGTDSFSWVNCHADYDASSGTGRGFAVQPVGALTGKPLFEVLNCTVSRWAETLGNLDDSGDLAATADVGSYGIGGEVATAMRLVVHNLKHVDSAKPVYVRLYGSYAHDVAISGCDLWIKRGGSTGGKVEINRNVVRGLALNYLGYAARMSISDNDILGRITAQAAMHMLHDNTVAHTDESDIFLQSNASGKTPAYSVKGNVFSKAVNAFGATLRVGTGSQAGMALLQGNTFYNSGASSAATPFISRGGSVTAFFAGELVDDTVVNTIDTETASAPVITPTGVQKVTMH